MNDYQHAKEAAGKALGFAAASASDGDACSVAALRGIGYAILALAAAIYNEKVELTAPRGRSQVIATTASKV
jgi:hypothetical protein